jgi:hypothetical protein
MTANTRMRSLIGSIVVVLLSPYLCAQAAVPGVTTLTGELKMSDLPSAVVKPPVGGIPLADTQDKLKSRPSVTLDHATLQLVAPTGLGAITLRFSHLELKHSRILTHGVDVWIQALSITSDEGEIVSFEDRSRPPPSNSQNGEPGRDAGTVVLDGQLGGGVLHVVLRGENGQPGGAGSKGPKGASGSSGNSSPFGTCVGRDGGAGSRGGQGGTGGGGGNGGSGGILVLRGQLAAQREKVDFTAPGGKPGDPGNGGEGGDGGDGGREGKTRPICHLGHPGPTGPPGEKGQGGDIGKPGRDGLIVAN